MKKHLLTLFCLSLFINVFAQDEIPASMYFNFTDIDGNTHNLSDYMANGKSVFLFEFLNHGDSYVALQNYNLDDLYNTYGQGGTNEIVVLCLAGDGFETGSDLFNNNYVGDLGPGYEDVNFTDNNPAPIAVMAENPGTVENTEAPFILHVLCADDHYTTSNATTADGHMAILSGLCCVGNETYDPALTSLTFPDMVDCNPQEVSYRLSNGTPVPLTTCDIDVLINDIFEETITYTGNIGGCDSEDLDYTNLNLVEGDHLTFAISSDNENTDNDTIDIEIMGVDTVRGQIKMELQNPADPFFYVSFAIDPEARFLDESTHWYNQIFIQDVGCKQLAYSGEGSGLLVEQALLITSMNENETIQDTIIFIEGETSGYWGYKNIYVDVPATPYLWGYVFEDANENQSYSPSLPGISGVQLTQGVNETFSDANGYYQLPITPTSPIEIAYDQTVWPVLTTPSAGVYNPDFSVYNFGLNQNDPEWNVDLSFDNGIPFMCESYLGQYVGFSNSGNQPTALNVVVTHDADLVVTDINPTPTSVNGNEYTFDLGTIDFSESIGIWFTYADVPASMLGEFIDTQIDYSYSDTEGNLIADESFTATDSVFCAYDPNDIYGLPLGEGPTGLIAAGTDLDYRIRFQNTGNAPATQVRITHTVPEELNWESIVPGSTSHVAIIEMNSDTREMTWVFNNINLPDSTTDAEGSKGYVWYKVEMNDLNPGDEIENVAEIYFDDNDVVITNTSLHTISDEASSVRELEIAELIAYPNPTRSIVSFDLAGINQAKRYSVMDISGRIIQSGNVSGLKMDIDLSPFESGVYAVVFFSGDQSPMARASVMKVE